MELFLLVSFRFYLSSVPQLIEMLLRICNDGEIIFDVFKDSFEIQDILSCFFIV